MKVPSVLSSPVVVRPVLIYRAFSSEAEARTFSGFLCRGIGVEGFGFGVLMRVCSSGTALQMCEQTLYNEARWTQMAQGRRAVRNAIGVWVAMTSSAPEAPPLLSGPFDELSAGYQQV